jgi:hypothetical protein
MTDLAAFATWQQQRTAYDASVASVEVAAGQDPGPAAQLQQRYQLQRQERAARQESETRERLHAMRSSEDEVARPHSASHPATPSSFVRLIPERERDRPADDSCTARIRRGAPAGQRRLRRA